MLEWKWTSFSEVFKNSVIIVCRINGLIIYVCCNLAKETIEEKIKGINKFETKLKKKHKKIKIRNNVTLGIHQKYQIKDI